MITIAIAGTAGRKDDADRMSWRLYQEMEEATQNLIEEIADGQTTTIISGGAAYADHIAVRLFLKGAAPKLILHLPCAWASTRQFRDIGGYDWKKNPGGTANTLHKRFQAKTGVDSFSELAQAIASPNCKTSVSAGFFERNALMAEADALIALTFGRCATVKDGGTMNTCKSYLYRIKKSRAVNLGYHIDLSHTPLVAYSMATGKAVG